MQPGLNSYIDHTLLKPDATAQEIEKLCDEAKQFHFASVCVNPTWVKSASQWLKGSSVKVCSVVGFPLGANTSVVKILETQSVVVDGAEEIDMVMNIGALKSKQYDLVKNEIRSVVQAASPHLVKVIIETCLLTEEEKVLACQLSVDAGAHFVKTSTGFSKSGATVSDIALMRQTVGPSIGVKASGGIADKTFALELIAAGATRIGTSKGIILVA